MPPPSVSVPDDIWQSFSSDQLAQRSQAMLDGLKQKFTDAMTPSAPSPSAATLAPSTGLPSLDALMSPFAPAARSLGASAVSGQSPDGSSPSPDDSSPPYTPTASSPATSGLPSFQSLPALGSLVASALPQSTPPPTPGEPGGPPLRNDYAPLPLSGGQAPSAAPGGPIDNSSRASFARTAYPAALRAAGGDAELAKRFLASAISENGTVGAGGPIGVGNNFGGIKYDPQASGSGNYGTWESEGGQRVPQAAGFAHYNSPEEGFAAIPRFIQTNFPKQWAQYQQTHDAAALYAAINAGGYATDPQWAAGIEGIASQQVAPAIAGVQRTAPAAAASAAPSSGSLDADGIVKAYSGTSYTYGGPGGRTAGFGAPTDCSGFVSAVYQSQYGLDLVPHTDGAYNQLKQLGAPEVKTADARPGDVVFYLGAGTGGAITHHMGVYAGDGKVLDDSVSGQDGVHVRDVGHAGQYVILRDPRLNTQTPASASAPPPIQPSGLAEQTGGAKVNQQQLAQAATSQPAAYPPGGPAWTRGANMSDASSGSPKNGSSATDGLMLRQPLGQVPTSMTTMSQDSAPTWQDDQTQSGYVQPDMAPGPPIPDMTGTAAQAPESPWRPPDATSSPLKPVYDLAGTVTGYVHTGLGALSSAATAAVTAPAPSPGQPAPFSPPDQRATGYGQDAINLGSAVGQAAQESGLTDGRVGRSILDYVDQARAETDHQLKRQQEILQQAGDWEDQNGTPDRTLGIRAVTDPAWRAANPDLADEYDQLNRALVIGAGQASNPLEAAKAAEPALQAARPAITRGIEAVRNTVSDIGSRLDQNAARVGALDAERAGQEAAPAYGALGVTPPASEAPLAQIPPYSPTAPEGFVRRYHGGSSDFAAVEPGKLNERSLWGPGYYVTDEPRVAGGIVDESGRVVSPGYAQERGLTSAGESKVAVLSNQRAAARMDLERAQARLQRAIDASPAFPQSQNVLAARRSLEPEIARAQARLDALDQRLATAAGPNVRALDVPTSLNLLETNQAAPTDIVDRVGELVEKAWGSDRQFGQWLSDEILTPLEQAQKQGPISGETLATTVRDAANAVEEPALIPEILKRLGYDGITHPGGLIRPMYDETGQAIQHTATVIFPDSIGKVRNATAGTYGGAALGQAPAFPGAQAPRGSGFFDRATPILSQGLASSVSGGVGAATAQQLGDPNDPNRALKGFVAGAAIPFAAGRAGAALGRRFGAAGEAGAAEGALATAGTLPPRRGRAVPLPELSVAEQAARYRAIRQAAANGTPLEDALAAASPARPAGATQAELMGMPEPPPMQQQGAPATRTAAPTGTQTMEEGLPGLLAALSEHGPRARAERAAQEAQAALPDPGAQPVGRLQSILGKVGDAIGGTYRRSKTVRMAGMLSDTAGRALDIFSNTVAQAGDVATGAAAVPIDMARVAALRAAGRPAERVAFAGETPRRLAGMRAGLHAGWGDLMDAVKGGLSGSEQAKVEGSGFDAAGIPGLSHLPSSVTSGVDLAVEAPLRLLSGADALFRSTATGGHLMAESYAAAKAANGGAEPTSQMIRQAANDPAVLKRVQDLSKRSVLQEDRNVTDAYRSMTNRLNPVPRAILQTEIPFLRTPWNIMAQGAEMTPLGAIGALNDFAHGRSREGVTKLARSAIGTSLMGLSMNDYANGNLTGPRPTDQKEISTLPPGWQPWSRKVTVGGQTYYVPLAALGPYALPAVAAILAVEAKKKGTGAGDVAGRMVAGVGQYASQNSFLQGFDSMYQTLQNPDRMVENHIEQIAASYSPHVIGGGALGRELQRIMGMPTRDPHGAWQAIEATLPYAAGKVAPSQDVLGRPKVPYAPGPIGAVARIGQQRDVDVIRAFRQAKQGLPLAPPKQVTDPGTAEQTPLSVTQQKQWQRDFGAALRDGYDQYGNPDDAATLAKIEAQARESANQAALGLR